MLDEQVRHPVGQVAQLLLDAIKYLPATQERHKIFVEPEQVEHEAWQEAQELSDDLGYFPAGQVEAHVVDDK